MDEAASGELVYLEHIYLVSGDYTIRAKARDVMGEESEWATLSVSMSKSKPIIYSSLLLVFLEQFPILARLLNL
jgi:hypothetical protein